jgi:colicin import membrane protein
MNAVHDGYYDEEIERARPAIIDDEPVDLREQQELYAQAQHRAHLAEVRFEEERRQRVEREDLRPVQQMWEGQVRAQQQHLDERTRLAQLRLQQWRERRAAEAEERRDQEGRLVRQQWQERRAAEAEAQRRDQQARLVRQQWQERRAAEAEAERREQQARLERFRYQQWQERERRRTAEAEAAERRRANEVGGWCTIM